MSQSHLILSNALIIWASRLLLLVPQLVLVPYLIATIGESGYGIYALVWSLLMGIDQLEKSLQSGVVKYSAGFLAQKRMHEVNRVVSSSFIFSLALSVLAALGITAIAFNWGLGGTDMTGALLIVAALMFLIVPLTPYLGIIQARQQYFVNAIAETVSKYLSLGIIYTWFTWVEPSVTALVAITAGMLFVSRLAQVPVAYRLVHGLRNRPALTNRASFGLLLSFGGVTVLIALANIANNAGLRWLMGILESPAFVAHLAIMLMPGLLVKQIVQAMTVTIMPATSAYEAAGNKDLLRELLLRSMRYVTIIVLISLIAALLLMEDALNSWVGGDYLFLAPYAISVFASNCLLMTASSAHHMLKGLGRLRTTAFAALAGMVVVPFALILPTLSQTGNPYLAASLGLIVGNIAWAGLHAAFALGAVGAHWTEALKRVYAQPLLAAGVALLPAFLLSLTGNHGGLPGRLGITCLTTGLFLAQMYFVYATPAERKQARDMAAALVRRCGAAIKRSERAYSCTDE